MLVDVKGYLTAVWVCTSQMTYRIEHLFMSLSVGYISSLENCLFGFFRSFLTGLLIFLLWSVFSFPF